MDPLLTATHLEHWADTRRAQDELPLVVRRLIVATVTPVHIDFPSGDSINRPGWDGVLRTADSATPVPAGQSVWEMGVGTDPRGKAQADYATRTSDPKGVRPAETTFVFVTPRRWQGKEGWAEERRKQGVWRDVRVVDAVDLEQWLDRVPAAAAWARRLVAGVPEEVQGLDGLWDEWAGRTHPPLTPTALTAGRGEAAARLRAWLDAPPAVLRVRGDTAEEAVAFLAAAVQSLGEPQRELAVARSLVVSTPQAWRAVAGGTTPTVVVASTAAFGGERAAVGRGHHVFVPYGHDAAGVPVDVSLPQPRRGELEAALREMGLDDERCRAVAAESHGRLPAVIELLGGGVTPPGWARPECAPQVVPLLLAGGWCQTTADMQAVARLARVEADELAGRLARWANEADPPVRLVGGQWEWVSRRRAWPHLGRFVTAADLDALRRVAVDVLGEHDPRFDLPVGERWRAGVVGAVPRYSDALRRGLAESLAMLAAGTGEVRAGVDPAAVAYRVVSEVFGPTPLPARWYSLAPVLPLLAEAVPDQFLGLVERDVVNDDGVRDALFAEEGMHGGGSRRCHLLWALECVAWAPDHLARSAAVLGGLAAHDPGGHNGNRPDESLRAIFLPWRPHTTASPRERLAALDGIHRRHPEVAFRLALQLLPRGHDTVMPTAQPRWRPWAETRERGVLTSEYVEYATGLAERGVRLAGSEEGRWAALLDPLRDMPGEPFDALFTRLEALPLESLAEAGDGSLRRAVRQILHHRLTVPGTFPEITPDHEARLRVVYDRLAPSDPVRRDAWLFDRRPQLLTVRGNDWRAEEDACRREREAAVRGLLAVGTAADLLRLAGMSENPWAVGFFAAQADLPDPVLLAHLAACLEAVDERHREYARGLVWGRFGRDGWGWVDGVASAGGLSDWPVGRLTQFAAALPFECETWDRVERWHPELAAYYWRIALGWVTDATRDGPRAVRSLLAQGRPFAAFEAVGRCTVRPDGDRAVSPSLLLEVLRAITAAIGEQSTEDRPAVDGGFGYQLGELLGRLQEAGVVDEGELARHEWAWYPVLHRSRRGVATLHLALTRDPAFFASLVGLIYRPRFPGREDDPPPVEADEAARSRASQAWQVLTDWHGLPGAGADGGFDEGEFVAWATAVRMALAESGHAGVGDHHLGQVLARTPAAPDGSWPRPGLAEWVEGVGSDRLESEIVTGVLNARGVTCRSMDAGGEQERELAARYDAWAAAAWATPRVARLLRQVADSYRAYARREDEDRDLREFWR